MLACASLTHLVHTMLTFDIETTGLDGFKDSVTCVCLFNSDTNTQHSYVFDHPPRSEDSLRKQAEVTLMLDSATQLCGFNSVRFDLAFLSKAWVISPGHLAEWVVKVVDVFEACKQALDTTFPLNALLAANGLETKTGSGLEAVRLAKEGKWTDLADYCMMDVLLTHQVTSLPLVNLPKTHIKWSMERGFFIQ